MVQQDGPLRDTTNLTMRDIKRPRKSDIEPSTFETDLRQLAHDMVDHKSEFASDQIWSRPQLPHIDPTITDINFQQIEVDDCTINGSSIIRFYGVTENGNSILCKVTDFYHYFFVPAPPAFQESDIVNLIFSINNQVGPMIASEYSSSSPAVHDIRIVEKQSLWGYNGNEKGIFLQIFLSLPAAIGKVRNLFEHGSSALEPYFSEPVMTYDNIAYTLRLMVDCGISGMSWITLPQNKYTIDISSDSNCQLSVSVPWNELIAHPAEGEWSKMAPLRVLSYDIECAGRKGIFPEPEIDPIIQIANVVSVYGQMKPFIRNIFLLDTCEPILGSEVLEHKTEAAMLMAWKNFVVKCDPDIIIGYNTANFDMPYLLNRAAALKLDKFPYFGRLANTRQNIHNSTFSSKAYGTRESKSVNIEGRLQFDLLQFIQREYKLRSYTLNAVSANFLGEQKEDVHHSMITELQNGTPETRRRLAVYCLKDAYLCVRLAEKLMCLVNYTEMARVTGVPFSYLLSRGQQIKVVSQLFRKALSVDIVIPNLKSQGGNDDPYEGATVIEPVRGYYDVPITTLDFSSLYPSIMMAHNLCYTTLLNQETISRLSLKEDEDYTRTPNGDCFVKREVRQGLLPQILQELLAARKRAKVALAQETDPFKKNVLNGRQLALKISANSVYGFTGAVVGKLPCLAISSSTTAYGRDMIMKTKNLVETMFTVANGYEHDAQVVYGDTDSVMIKFGTKSLERAMELGRIGAEEVSKHFLNPVKLEFEKVYFPYLLISKKRYVGLYWTKTDKFDKMDTKGIETVRRDNCQLVQQVMERVLDYIMIKRDVPSAENYVKQVISDLIQNKVDLSQLVISKQLGKDYTAKQAHAELAKRMFERDPGSAPNLGDRVAYVIIKGDKKDKNYDKSEDPIYVLENNLEIDTTYYLENQLSGPLMRLFEPILGETQAQSLFYGEHTRVSKPSAPVRGMFSAFTKKVFRCRGCSAPLKGKYAEGALCEKCIPKANMYYQKQLMSVSQLEVRYTRLWTQCQRCQESLHQDVICSSRDCPIFYMRKKVQKELVEETSHLARFDKTAW
ncbi:hypothetical protein CANCADRAFT_89320 [Tortispora caseinolytica NRRL Y-17796]|uniref:DNA polymerase n=1 Tax=Tortispora caseinolytica NRRL Y-17796 TaxID=767744 RepID=A0A1E4TLF2_9ASCO|nr:hypothetical protein CANCADRAFT_89320 [Tortispora caseinolytica NRRL Y-17796]